MTAELIAVLLSWAVTLSGYPEPAAPPAVRLLSHTDLARLACGGDADCPALGWYNDRGVVYFDARLDVGVLQQRGLVVHEFVHYLQHLAGQASHACASVIAREREAYAVQTAFVHAHGAGAFYGVVTAPLRCR